MSAAKCYQCGTPLSHETGLSMTGGLGDNSQDRLWCPEHAPTGKGYTLADLEAIGEGWKQMQRDRQLGLMERLGPDVYFHVLGAPPNIDGAEQDDQP